MNNIEKTGDTLSSQPIIEVKTSESFAWNENSSLNHSPNGQNKDNNAHDYAGKHYIVDFWGAQHLDDVEVLESALRRAAEVAGAVLLHIHLHKFSTGGGVTGAALLAESHISVHTWPENSYAAFDIFMCGNAQPEKAVALLKEVFSPTKTEIKEILRGRLKED